MKFYRTNICNDLLKLIIVLIICSTQLSKVKSQNNIDYKTDCDYIKAIFKGFNMQTEEWRPNYNDCCDIGTIECDSDKKVLTLNFTKLSDKYRRQLVGGRLIDEIGELKSLKVLDLSGVGMYGDIPKSIGSLTNLEDLTLNDNEMSGKIPKEIGSLRKLQKLNLANNYFYDFLPGSMGDLYNLKELYLQNNRLEGAIPSQLSNLKSLEVLNVAGNKSLKGRVPTLNSLRTCDYTNTTLCILPAERCKSNIELCNKENEELTVFLLKQQAEEEEEDKSNTSETRPSGKGLWEILYTPYIFLIIIIVVVLIILLVIYCIKGYIESKYEAELKKALEKRQQYSNTNSVKSMRSNNRKYQNEEHYEANDRETGYFSTGDDIRLNNHRFNESTTILSGTRNYRPAYTENTVNNFDYDSVNAQLISPIVSPSSPMYNPPTLAYSPIPHSTVASHLASNEYIYYDPVNGTEYNTNTGSVYLSSPKAAQVARSLKNNARSQVSNSPYNPNYYNANDALYSGSNKNGKRSVAAYNNYDNESDSYEERKSSTRQGYQSPERNDQEDDEIEPKSNLANTTNFSLATTNSSSKLDAANFRIATTESSSKLDTANFRIATTKSSSKEDLSDESYYGKNIQNEHEQHDNNNHDNNDNLNDINNNNNEIGHDNNENDNVENDEIGNDHNVNDHNADNAKNQVLDTTRNTSNPVLSKAELAKRESSYIKAHKKKIPVLVDRKRQSYHSIHSNVPLTNRNSISMSNLVQLGNPTIVPVQSQYTVVQNAIPNEQYIYEASSSSNNVVQPGRVGSSNKRGNHLSMVSVQSIPTAVYVTDDAKQVYVTPLVSTNDNQNVEYVNYVDNASDINEGYNIYSNPNIPGTPVNINGVTYIPASSSVNVQPHIGASPLIAPHSPNYRVIAQRNLPVDASPHYTSSVHTVSPYIKDINRAEINHAEHNDSDQVSTNQYYVTDEAGETEEVYYEEDTNEDAPPPYASQ